MDTKKLRQKILDLAIRGKLVPQNPNDEPASVLIEKYAQKRTVNQRKKLNEIRTNHTFTVLINHITRSLQTEP